jgi:hypothetical protein
MGGRSQPTLAKLIYYRIDSQVICNLLQQFLEPIAHNFFKELSKKPVFSIGGKEWPSV